jgi:hypothetical protein
MEAMLEPDVLIDEDRGNLLFDQPGEPDPDNDWILVLESR